MQDRFEDYRTFISVVQARSFAAAARRLGLAKSAVSRRIQELEERLGATLFNRTTRAVSLTDLGREFYERAIRLLADVEEAESVARRGALESIGSLRISGPMSFGVLHLAPILCHFMDRNPRLTVELMLEDRHVDLVAEGFDLAIRIGELSDSTLKARRIADIRRVVCASPAYLKRYGTPKQPSDLAHHRGIGYLSTTERRFWSFVRPDTGERATVEVPSPLQLNNGDAMREAAIAGYGVAALPTFIVHRAIASGDLVPLLLPFEKESLGLYTVYPPQRTPPAKVRAFVDFMIEQFGDRPYWDRDVFGPAASPVTT